jgi:hypothetical protein
MLHAHVPKATTPHCVTLKTCIAPRCGHETTYTTCPPQWCHACNPNKRYRDREKQRTYRRECSRRRMARLRAPAEVPVVHDDAALEVGLAQYPVNVPPRFCLRCGITRLSEIDLVSTCLSCCEELSRGGK